MEKNIFDSAFEFHLLSGNRQEVVEKLGLYPIDSSLVVLVAPHSKCPECYAKIERIIDVLTSTALIQHGCHRCINLTQPADDALRSGEIQNLKFRSARMLAKAMGGILQSGDFVTTRGIVQLTDEFQLPTSAHPSEWKRDGTIFSINVVGEDLFPLYALQPTEGFRPFRELKDIIALFKDLMDGWGIAFWFLSANSHLGGCRPKEVLRADPRSVIDAARAEVSEILHG